MQKNKKLLLLLILSVWLVECLFADVSFQGIGDLPGGDFKSLAFGVSADGSTVVGRSSSASGEEPFRWTKDGGMEGLGNLPNYNYGNAYHVSSDGSVIVGSSQYGYRFKAFIWTEGTGVTALSGLPEGDFDSYARDVSDDGRTIIGSVNGKAYKWTFQEGFEYLTDSDNKVLGSAVAVSADGTAIAGQFYHMSSTGEVTHFEDVGHGDLSNQAHSISSDGLSVVGNLGRDEFSFFSREAFLWNEENGMITLGVLSGNLPNSDAADVSADGSIVVGFCSIGNYGSYFRSKAFIWDEINGMQDVKELLENSGLDLTGWRLEYAMGISADGKTIVGRGINPDGFEEGWIATIPEPTSLALLALGGLFLRKKTVATRLIKVKNKAF